MTSLLSVKVDSALLNRARFPLTRFFFSSCSLLSLFVNEMSYTICKFHHPLPYNLVKNVNRNET